jgi:hypothetical protein
MATRPAAIYPACQAGGAGRPPPVKPARDYRGASLPSPSWLARETWAALPASFVLREVRHHLDTPGFRARRITLVTTRLDAAVKSL